MEEIPCKIEPIIRLNDVSIGYKEDQPLVQIPNLEIFPGEIVAIAGPSGVGKSTLLKTIAGLMRPISGSVEVCGKISPKRVNRGELGYVPQSLGLVRHASVQHNVMLGANAGHNYFYSFLTVFRAYILNSPKVEKIVYPGLTVLLLLSLFGNLLLLTQGQFLSTGQSLFGIVFLAMILTMVEFVFLMLLVVLGIRFPSSFAKRKALDSIKSMGLEEKISEPIRRLSGGQQRRVATARTLAQSPNLILADEFLSELDQETIDMVLGEVTEYVRSNNAALLVVEHDISRAKMMADRLLVIDDGRVNPFITEPTAMEVKI